MWSTTGLIISVLPSVLAFHNLRHWSGISTLIAINCGLLFQPLARKFESSYSTRIGLVILLPAYVLLAWGALHRVLLAVSQSSVVELALLSNNSLHPSKHLFSSAISDNRSKWLLHVKMG